MKILLTFFILSMIVFHVSAQNVGINTTMPDADLHVNGDVIITDGTQGEGKVLTSNSTGLASWRLPRTYFTLGTDQSVSTNTFVGLGSASSTFIRNTIIVPFNGTITSLVFTVRNLMPSSVICEIHKSSNGSPPTYTGMSVFVVPFSYYASAIGSVTMNVGDLLSVKIITTGGSVTDGIAATIGYQ